MTEIARISVADARPRVQNEMALLVCAYADEAKFNNARLDGAISLASLKARADTLPKGTEPTSTAAHEPGVGCRTGSPVPGARIRQRKGAHGRGGRVGRPQGIPSPHPARRRPARVILGCGGATIETVTLPREADGGVSAGSGSRLRRRDLRRGAAVGFPIARPLQVEHLGPLGEPVQDGVGHGVVGEDLVPLPERPVRGDHRRLPPVMADGDHLEHQVALRLAETDVADFVDL